MSERYFLDAGVFLKCFDASNPEDRDIANKLVNAALSEHVGVTGSHAVHEFLETAIHHFDIPLESDHLQEYMEFVLLPLCEVNMNGDLFKIALQKQRENNLTFRDALIFASASKVSCSTVLSAHLKNGMRLSGIIVKNPFRQSL